MFWGEANEATPPEDSVILDEWGVIQEISKGKRVDLMPSHFLKLNLSLWSFAALCGGAFHELPRSCRKIFNLSYKEDLMCQPQIFCIIFGVFSHVEFLLRWNSAQKNNTACLDCIFYTCDTYWYLQWDSWNYCTSPLDKILFNYPWPLTMAKEIVQAAA